MDAAPRIHFVLDPRSTRWDDIERLDEQEIARTPSRFVGGRNAWIAQSYLRLRGELDARGWRPTAGPGFPAGAVCIAHRDDANRFGSPAYASFLVVVRADRPRVEACDLAIVQNGLARSPRERFVPQWPQPGLLAREAARGFRIERMAYQGRTSSAPRWFHDAPFLRDLGRRKIEFEVREHGWEDYRGVDLAIAAREELPLVLEQKPATKLYNAWLAGAPMLATPEPAYRELRRRSIDFIEIDGPADVLQAIDLLRANPHLYAAMVRNGRLRGAAFDVDAIRSRWLDFLQEEVLPAYRTHPHGTGPARRAWFLCAMARQKAASRLHRVRRAAQAGERLGHWVARGLESALTTGAARRGGRTFPAA